MKRGHARSQAARRYAISESVAIKWLERVERDGSREPVGHGGHRASKLMPHRDFLEATPPMKSQQTKRNLSDDLELWWLVSFDHWLSLKAREKKRPGQ